MLLPAFLLFAVTIATDQAQLRSSCTSDSNVVATLQAGAAVALQFSLNDGSNCYKVAVELDGRQIEGYIAGAALTGLDEFERARRSAPDGSSVRLLTPIQSLASRGAEPVFTKAADLLKANQPAQALALLEPTVRDQPRNADLLTLAGIAAYHSDRVPDALDYWKRSLDLRPDPGLLAVYHKAEREAAADRSTQKLYGMKVLLRFEEGLSRETAGSIVALLDQEVTRVSTQLGCGVDERLVAIVQSRQAYLRSTDAAEWSAAQFDGRIRVALPENGSFGPEIRRVVAHEVVHACLANLPGRWPAWFHEGLAQKLSGDVLSASASFRIRQLAAAGSLPRLENISQSWSRMSADHARLSYQLALAAVDLVCEMGIRNVLANPDRLPSITKDVDLRLGL